MRLFPQGQVKLSSFCTIASSESGIRTMMKDSFGLDEDADFPTRMAVGSDVNAWAAAKAQMTRFD